MIELDEQQKYGLKCAIEGKDIFLSGPGGTGKSFLLKKIISTLRSNNKKVAVSASTGIAAVALNGCTIHSLLGTGIKGTVNAVKPLLRSRAMESAQERLRGVSTIIVDEVSMLTGDYIDMMDYWLRVVKKNRDPFGGIQIILCGDLLQLTPVITNNDYVENQLLFESKVWSQNEFIPIYLKTPHRASGDWKFNLALSKLREGYYSPKLEAYLNSRVGVSFTEPTKLVSTNKEAIEINKVKMAEYKVESKFFQAEYTGSEEDIEKLKKNCTAEDNLELKIGVPVLCLVNNQEAGYINGTRGIVSSFGDKFIAIELEDGELIQITKHTWELKSNKLEAKQKSDDKSETNTIYEEKVLAEMKQYPLKPAFAITIHKSQGMTLEQTEINLQKCFANHQAYVALSRLKTIEDLSLTVPIQRRHIKTDPRVAMFYQSIEQNTNLS